MYFTKDNITDVFERQKIDTYEYLHSTFTKEQVNNEL